MYKSGILRNLEKFLFILNPMSFFYNFLTESGEVKSAFAAKLKNLLASKMKFATQRLSAVMNPMTPKQDTVADFFQVMVETNMKYKVRQTKKGGRCQDSI